MRLEAIYEHGKVSFLQPIRLRTEPLRVIVEIPEEDILPQDWTDELDEHARALVAALDAIRNAPVATDDQHDLSPRAAERWAAFALRKDV